MSDATVADGCPLESARSAAPTRSWPGGIEEEVTERRRGGGASAVMLGEFLSDEILGAFGTKRRSLTPTASRRERPASLQTGWRATD